MGRRTFVSYSREDAVAVEALVRHLSAGGHDVWLDRRIGGGHDWWNTILQEIRDRDVVVVAVSPASVESAACAAELQYAVALGRTLVPVAVVDGISGRRLPVELARLQVVQYHQQTPEAAIELVRVVDAAAPSPPLPDPLPVPPPVPMSYMVALQERLGGPAPMSAADQASTIVRLKSSLLDEHEAADAQALLALMLRRDDLLASSQREIAAALADAPTATRTPFAPPVLGGATPANRLAPSPPAPAPSRKRHTGLVIAGSVVGTVIVLAAIGMALAKDKTPAAGGNTPASSSAAQASTGGTATSAGSSFTATSATATSSTGATVLDTVVTRSDATTIETTGPEPATFEQVEEATIVAADFPQGFTAPGAEITAPCSDEPAMAGVFTVATGSKSVDSTGAIFANRAGSFADASQAAEFVGAVGVRGTCGFTHADGSVEQVVGVQQLTGLPLGSSSAVVDYTLTLASGDVFQGRDAYLAIGRFVGVFTCAAPATETDALAEACGQYGERFGGKVGALFDKYG